jgi:5-methylcytosine-specific restriction endonuclease McrA
MSKIRRQVYANEYNATTKRKFESMCTNCNVYTVTPFDFKCVLINIRRDNNVKDMMPTCKNCYLTFSQENISRHKNPTHNQYIVYKKYYGCQQMKCYCCKDENITPLNFVSGHVISKNDGGKNVTENLKPICTHCNSRMSTQNMHEYMKRYFSDDYASDDYASDNLCDQKIIDDIRINKENSKYKDYVITKTPCSAHIKERVNILINKIWTVSTFLKNKQYFSIKIKNKY